MGRLRRPPLALAAVIAVATLACGGGSGDDESETGSPDREEEAAPATLLDPDGFAAEIARPEAFVVNVHIPYEGEIDGTDVHIPFDEIAGDDRLPADKDAELVLYCKTGRMSMTAAETLVGDGYTNLYDLRGGMVAWEAAGKELVHRQ